MNFRLMSIADCSNREGTLYSVRWDIYIYICQSPSLSLSLSLSICPHGITRLSLGQNITKINILVFLENVFRKPRFYYNIARISST